MEGKKGRGSYCGCGVAGIMTTSFVLQNIFSCLARGVIVRKMTSTVLCKGGVEFFTGHRILIKQISN